MKPLRIIFFAVVVFTTITFAATRKPRPSSAPHPSPEPKTDPELRTPGDARTQDGCYNVVFYYTPGPTAPPEATARALLQQSFPGIPILTGQEDSDKLPFFSFEEEKAPLQNFLVPEASYFDFAGRGLTAKDIAAVQKSSRATSLTFFIPQNDVWTLGRKFTLLAAAYAEKTNAFIWDGATRELYSRAAWQKLRVETWPENGLPDLKMHLAVHAYRPEEGVEYIREITLGMEKFALPDVLIERISSTDSTRGGDLLHLVCQSLAERPQLTSGAREVFKLKDLRTDAARQELEKELCPGATGEITLAVLEGKPAEGDPENRVLKLDFRNGQGGTENEKRADLLRRLWGLNDAVIPAGGGDAELAAAEARAKAKLPEIQARFLKGLGPNDHLRVKVAFAADGGREWMWLEVLRWPKDGAIQGILQNESAHVKNLQLGAQVEAPVADVKDYTIQHADGTSEGNESGQILERRDREKKAK